MSSYYSSEEAARLAAVVPLVHWVTSRIAITNVVTANCLEILQTHGVGPDSILCLDQVSQARYGLDSRRVVPLVDGDNALEVFSRAVSALRDLLERRSRVLVHCHAGRSRSIAVVAAYLAASEGMTPEVALAFVAERRPCPAVMPGLVRNLQRYCHQIEYDNSRRS